MFIKVGSWNDRYFYLKNLGLIYKQPLPIDMIYAALNFIVTNVIQLETLALSQ